MLQSGSSKGSNKPVPQKTGATLANFYAVLSNDYCDRKTLSLEFMQIFADDQGTFCLVFAFYFTSCKLQFECLPYFGMSQY